MVVMAVAVPTLSLAAQRQMLVVVAALSVTPVDPQLLQPSQRQLANHPRR